MKWPWSRNTQGNSDAEKKTPSAQEGRKAADRVSEISPVNSTGEAGSLVTEQIDTQKEEGTFSIVFSQIRTHTDETIRIIPVAVLCTVLMMAVSEAGWAKAAAGQEMASSEAVSAGETTGGTGESEAAGQETVPGTSTEKTMSAEEHAANGEEKKEQVRTAAGSSKKQSGAKIVSGAYLQEGSQILWYVSGIRGNVNAMSAVIGSSVCPILADGKVSENVKAPRHTVILVDNSASIADTDRGKIRDLLAGLIERHAENETFSIYTYSTALAPVCEGTDYEVMQKTVQGLEFTDQYSWPVSALDEALSDMQGSAACRRIILITDGADDSALGISCSELQEMMKDQTYRCQVYTVFAQQETHRKEQRELAALSRQTGAQSWQLDSYGTGTALAQEIMAADEPEYFLFQIPAQEKDGREKELTLYLETDQENVTLSDSVRTPLRTESEHQEMIRRIEDAKKETEVLTEKPTEILTEEPLENMTEQVTQPQRTEDLQTEPAETEFMQEEGSAETGTGAAGLLERVMKNPLLSAGCAGVLLGIAGIVLWLILRRTADGDQNDSHAPSGKGDHVTAQDHTQILFTDYASPEEGTILMWTGAGEKPVYLTDTRDCQRQWALHSGQETVLGRRSSVCDISFPEDKTISGRHAKIVRSGEETLLTDLGSANGTFLNGSRITGTVRVRNGDLISLGRISLRVVMTGGNEE